MANNSLGKILFHGFSTFLDLRTLYNDIKNNPEAKKTSTVLGKKAIGFWIGFILSLAAGGGLIFWGISMFQSIYIIFGIILLVAGVSIAGYSLLFLVVSINATIKQLCLNRKVVGWVALSLHIITIIAIGVGILFIISKQ